MKKLPTAIMIDLETTDNIATSATVSIGAVALNQDGVFDAKFYIPVTLESGLQHGMSITSDTMGWWRKQSPEAKAVFTDENAVDIVRALNAFNNWANNVCGGKVGNTKLFGNGAAFDCAILEHAYRATGVKSPFKFWNLLCYRTIKEAHKEVKIERLSGEKNASHNALTDAYEQAVHLIEINKQAGGIYL